MPIALFPELTTTLAKVGASLFPWERLTTLEEQILRRARSAFLVHWFGTGLPERRLSLLIAIDNIAELRARYALVKRSMPGPLPEMNLLRPIAGMAGFAAGLFFSPSGVFLFAPYIHRLFDFLTDSWWGPPASMIYSLLNWAMPLLGPGVLIGVIAPLLLAYTLGVALGGDRRSRAIVRLVGDVTMLADAFLVFWRQVTGPEEDIQNPVVKGIVVILRRFAALFAQVLGFAALLVTRLLPLVPNLIEQFRAAMALGEAVVATVRDVTRGLMDALMSPFAAGGGLSAILTTVMDAFKALPVLLLDHVRAAIDDVLTVFRAAYDSFNHLLGNYISGVGDRIVAGFGQTPLGQMISRIQELVALVPQLFRAFRAIPETPSGEPATNLEEQEESMRNPWLILSDALLWGTAGVLENAANVIRSVRRLRLPTTPSSSIPALPSMPTLPDTAALRAGIGLPGPIDFAAQARRLLEEARAAQGRAEVPAALLRRPASQFAAERARQQALGPPVLSERETQLREAVYLAVGRVLPPALRVYAPRLHNLFQQIDALLYGGGEPPNPSPEMPQLELSDSGLLRPVVEVLTIRSSGGFAPDLRAFRDLVVEAMERQTYLAPDAA
jgi:hypothetical protein